MPKAPPKKKSRPRARARGRERPPVPQLSRERIAHAALELVDRGGVGALSMRSLGRELGMDPMAVYHYLPNKDALLDAIVEAVMGEIDLSQNDPTAPAEERIMSAALAYRDVMMAHARALPIILTRGPATPTAMRPVELLTGILRQAGLTPAQAMAGMNAIAAAVRGTVGMVAEASSAPPPREQLEAMAQVFPKSEFPYLHESMTCTQDFFERDFAFGIRALARGLLAMRGEME